MKAFFTIFVGFICLVLLILGNLHWQKKIEITGDGSSYHATAVNDDETEAFAQTDPLMEHAANWSEGEKQQFQTALAENRPYHILIVGSEQLGEGETSWTALFQNDLLATYGEQAMTIETTTYSETTAEFVSAGKQAEWAAKQADLIIWEPFVLTDNAVVPIEESHEYITTVMNEVKAANPNITFILQPPNPLYQPKLYRTQVEELKSFAEENNILYLDHWTSWPDPMSEQVRNYLNEDNQPNEEGHRVWAEFFIQRFIVQ
ncbi:SGNH/GDSL hydrolase family protein [Robertmurraya korlensis]|uniref:SGNH/GDSL hydrolase family protein n=1 Tax=Robertmurraya korlensis TaxID=519977 RepID=UPI002040954B|nr:SGNH/GDSL hydrolase family protein [Robertmurraya korlensis]MCM3602184.1 SGNH/GDSL hydrolase family protein [Robertmurraya korlensis]